MACIPRYDDFGQLYSQSMEGSASRPLERRTLLALAGPLQGRDLVDLACGTGDFGRHLLQHGARSALGVDLSRTMIMQARQQSAQCGDGMRFIIGDATRLPQVQAFDIVVAAWLFNHADSEDELQHMYRACARLLRPGGQLLGIVTHPGFRMCAGDFSRYGARVLSQRPLPDHHLVEVEFNGDASARVVDHQWRADQHEEAAARAGLPGLRWQAPVPGPEELQARPPGFWDAYLHNNLVVALHAQRAE